jgi:multicomponent K+:H+ antiporter subunit A
LIRCRSTTGEQALPGSGGKNVVNVILVDFRGFDTFGEIMVLGIAAMVIFALLDGLLNGSGKPAKLAAWTSGESYSPGRHPVVMVVVTRLMLPLSLMVAPSFFCGGTTNPAADLLRRWWSRSLDHAVHGQRLWLGRAAGPSSTITR